MIEIIPLEPLMMRDGRTFRMTPGIRAHSLDYVPPSVVAGTLRTMAVKSESMPDLTKLPIRGPLYLFHQKLFVPMPHDVAIYENQDGELQACYRRPQALPPGTGFLGTGNEFRHEDMWPAIAPKLRGKPAQKMPAFISIEWMTRYLAGELKEGDWAEPLAYWCHYESRLREAELDKLHFLPALVKEERTHTAIKPGTNRAEETKLYSTEGLVFPKGMSMIVQIDDLEADLGWGSEGYTIHSIGGKRRLAQFHSVDQPTFDSCPEEIREALAGKKKYVRMVLATPAYFDNGWLPRWLGTDLITNERARTFLGDIRLQLRWACVPRWQPVSGWSYSQGSEKSVRRMVPAGSVYFFEIIDGGTAEELADKLWLASVSDDNRRKAAFDKDDGFGLAMWGTWEPSSSEV
ncbi:type III-B CRISPR module-associated protein Cmr3 [Paenibacillus sp. NPDC058071]|uniref:type III-B CRISPR module-associated protein Cmr3 n=1 Tax=Paenibacillus sp. NPDC058071 TaxID=3346326 RepID=UPI0036DF984B